MYLINAHTHFQGFYNPRLDKTTDIQRKIEKWNVHAQETQAALNWMITCDFSVIISLCLPNYHKKPHGLMRKIPDIWTSADSMKEVNKMSKPK